MVLDLLPVAGLLTALYCRPGGGGSWMLVITLVWAPPWSSIVDLYEPSELGTCLHYRPALLITCGGNKKTNRSLGGNSAGTQV